MAKPRMIGKLPTYTPNAWRDLRYIRKTARAREKSPALRSKPSAVQEQGKEQSAHAE